MVSLRSLKERKLVQWAIAYAAGAWALLEVAALVADTYGWPDSVLRIATALVGVGFIAVLVLAWFHGEKGAQRVSGIELAMLTGILVIAGVAVAWSRGAHGFGGSSRGSAMSAEQGSIAVLPFADMSPDKDQEYFSDGITEELLNVLAQIPELRVASRTSAFSFKGSDVGIDSIARALNVRHVLEGSVRTAGDQVRITAQLIDASTGFHLWSRTYDRRMADIFAVQDEISRAIVDQLEIQLAGRDGPLARVRTADPEAHRLQLRARELVLSGGTASSLLTAERLYKEALERDSTYAAAWAGLGNVYRLKARDNLMPSEEGVALARTHAQRALELDSLEGDADLVLMATYPAQSEEARVHMERALELNPGDERTLSFYSGWLRVVGRLEEAARAAHRAVELDPLSLNALRTSANLYVAIGDVRAAEEMFGRLAELYPDNADGLLQLGFMRVLLGQREEAFEPVDRAIALSRTAENLGNAAWVYAYAGDFDRAIGMFRETVELEPDSPRRLATLANALAAADQMDEALRLMDRVIQIDTSGMYVTYGSYVLAKGGRRQAALDALGHPDIDDYHRAMIYANLGDEDRAFEALERAIAENPGDAIEIGADWWLDPLRGDPRMDRLIERVGVPEIATRR